jgi:hypothetical protein
LKTQFAIELRFHVASEFDLFCKLGSLVFLTIQYPHQCSFSIGRAWFDCLLPFPDALSEPA